MPKFELPKIEIPTIDIKSIDLPEVPEAAQKPIYAGVGATDLAVEKVKGYVADVQAKVTAKVADVQSTVKGFELPEAKTLQDRAASTFADRKGQAEAKLAELQADAKALPAKVQTTVKGKVDENVATATALYADLAKRGEGVVVKLRKSTPKPAGKKAPATKPAAKKAPAKKAAAKKAPAKKAAAK